MYRPSLTILLLIIATTALSSAAAQGAAPPAGDGPSLADTLSFAGTKLTQKGKTSWRTFGQAGDTQRSGSYSEEVTSFVPLGQCTVFYHVVWTNDNVLYGDDFSFELKDVKTIDAQSGNEEWGAGIGYFREIAYPAIFTLEIQGPATRGWPFKFTFTDASMAGRIARALAHAVELCGGSAAVRTGNLSGEELARYNTPPTAPSAPLDAPALASTLLQIQGMLQRLGKQGYVYHSATAGGGLVYQEVRPVNAAADPAQCKLSFRDPSVGGEEGNDAVLLKNVIEVSLEYPPTKGFDFKTVRGFPQTGGGLPPPLAPALVDIVYGPNRYGYGSEFLESFPFLSTSAANHFADLMRQAMQSCGGGKIDPF